MKQDNNNNSLPTQTHYSKSSKYRVEIKTNIQADDDTFNHSIARVFDTKSEKLLFEIKRNFGDFPYCFAENHQNGNDYFLCAEDYQGQTVLELNTLKRVDYLPKSHTEGLGFCIRSISYDRDGQILDVDGSYWGAPNEMRFLDFSEPMKLPYPIIDFIRNYEEVANWKRPSPLEITRKLIAEYNNPLYGDGVIPEMVEQIKLSLQNLSEDEIKQLQDEKILPKELQGF